MSVLPVGFGASGPDTGDITKSLRFRASGSTYMSRTFGTPTAATTWTFSLWVKRGALGAGRVIFSTSTGSEDFYFNPSDQIVIWKGGTVATSTAVFRDPSAHLHFVIKADGSTVKCYVNNSEVCSYTGVMAAINTAIAHRIGYDGAYYLDGYLSRICFVDGQALTPSSFGYLNTEINEWVTLSRSACKAVVDAGGTNSFMLDFEDGTSLTTLGNDYSTKNNDWTLTNHSLTAGVTYDWMEDRPGNSYAVLNPLYPSAANITNGNLSSGTTAARATMNSTAIDSQWFVTAGASAVTAGVIDDSGSTNTTTVTANKVFGFKMTAAGALSYKNVTDAGSWTSIATGLTGNRWPYSVTQAASWNFGQQPLPEALDTGFLALCQANLPEGAVRNPKKHFDAKTRTGTAATYSVTGIEFQPDFVWVKSRGRAVDHALYDRVRGVQNRLETNNTDAEVTGDTTGLTAFNSDGYTGGALDQINGTTATNSFIDWLWKANGAAVSNTNGTITSQVSANQTAGFSIVTYTGTGANATVGHGLGVAPKMVIVKARTGSGYSWITWHSAIAGTEFLYLELTNAKATDTTRWNSTVPSSSLVSVGTSIGTNENTRTYVAYCFTDVPQYSKVFSLTGNANADGTYVDLGFKPAFVLLKCSSTTGNWYIFDTVRNTSNVVGEQLYPNLANAGATVTTLDVTSRGFKLRLAGDPNAAQTYIGYAVAAVNGKYSNSL